MVPTDGVKKTRTSTPPPRAKVANKVQPQKIQNENLQKTGNQGKAAEVKAPSCTTFKKKVLSVCTRLVIISCTIGFLAVIGLPGYILRAYVLLQALDYAFITEWFMNLGLKQAFERIATLAVSDDVYDKIFKALHFVQTSFQDAIQTATWKDITLDLSSKDITQLPWTKIAAAFAVTILAIGTGLLLKKLIGRFFHTKQTRA